MTCPQGHSVDVAEQGLESRTSSAKPCIILAGHTLGPEANEQFENALL